MKVGDRDTYLFEELGETEARYPRVLEARLCKKIAWKSGSLESLKGCEGNKWELPIYTPSQTHDLLFPPKRLLVQKTRKAIITPDSLHGDMSRI